ncbi:MAG: fuculose phosphate aldolase [Chloroflexi bacterium]|nr:fuculose phosphate aldolase [Chloroflexota bacterium]
MAGRGGRHGGDAGERREEPGWQSLAEVGRDLWTAGLVTSHGGNVSLRRPRGGALITVTGAMLGRLEEGERFVPVNHGGQPDGVRGRVPSSDTKIHLAIYAANAEVGAVIHAHPVHAIALSFEWDVIQPRNLEGQVFLGRVPVITAEWEESAEPVATALKESPIVVVRGHGSYARGTDAWDALRVTSALEEAAYIISLMQRR